MLTAVELVMLIAVNLSNSMLTVVDRKILTAVEHEC